MTRFILIYGSIAGFITICTMLVGFALTGHEGVGTSQAVGFLIMFLAFSLIYFGVRKYRDQEQGGVITFGKASLIGLGMTVAAGIVYVLVWEIYLNITDYAFIAEYSSAYVEREEASGIDDDKLIKLKADMIKMVERYGNPLFRLPMTFLEIAPIGLIVSLVSAFFLRSPKSRKG